MTSERNSIPAREAAGRIWDVIVIGAGMGGGLVGRRLAERGLSVLFVEKGPSGYRTEGQSLRGADLPDPVARQMRGVWPTPVEVRVDGRSARVFAPLGCGVGGSSVFYAAALERPEPHDIETVSDLPHPTGGWPVSFDTFQPYFDEAAGLLSVRGTPDPLSDTPGRMLEPVPLTEVERVLFDDLRASGLHPYQAHEAVRRIPGCTGCIGRKCPRDCKMDGRSAGVEPALRTGRAHLLTGCTVERLEETEGRISSLAARTSEGSVTLRAGVYVLAAGALHSPRLLLASDCANSSGWVGRGLMFHLNELFALWPRRGQAEVGVTRAIGFRDFYSRDGQRLGLVQAMGVGAEFGHIAAYLKTAIALSPLRHLPGMDKAALVPAAIAARLFGTATIFVGLMEDLAYHGNRVTTHPDDPDMPMIEYTISEELKARRALFRRLIRRTFGWRRVLMLGFGPALNYGHPSGTLRFGTDPATSVLDAECRAHDVDNLYVADASFMPSSMGVNPSLTIAANALRVGDLVAARIEAARREAG